MSIRSVAYADAVALADAMSREMMTLYEDDEGASPAAAEEFLPPYGTFLVLTVAGEDVACGGLRLIAPGRGEVKRMYTAPSHRGKGHARTVLRALVEHARSVGLAQLWLETGVRQPEAIALYASEGFTPIPPFGYFANHPETLCFGRDLLS